MKRVSFIILLLLAIPAQAADRGLPDFAGLAEQVSPTVVNISTSSRSFETVEKDPALPEDHPYDDLFRRFFEPEEENSSPELFENSSLGSGVIISPDGDILTNYHVVSDADEIIVKLADRRQLRAHVVGVDRASDLALLKVDADNLPAARIGDVASLKVGEWVMAIGSPFGFDYSVTSGIVSAKGRSVGSERYVPYIQTDVAINPGNSGGPLFNLAGEVVGINSQIYSRTGGFMGVSFAIPVNLAMNVAAQLKAEGKVRRGWLGVDIQDVTRELAESFGMSHPEGALVRNVLPGSPAEAAGVEVGDVILSFNRQAIFSADELPPLVGAAPAGAELEIHYLRQGKQADLTVTLGELKQADLPAREELPVRDAGLLGLAVRELKLAERDALGLGEGGLLVERVSAGPAYEAGLRSGDIVLGIDSKPVESLPQFESIIADLPLNRHVAVLVQRDGTKLFFPVRLGG